MTENILHNVINGGVLTAITVQSGLKDATINMNVDPRINNRARNATRAFNKAFDSNTLMSSDESIDQKSLETSL